MKTPRSIGDNGKANRCSGKVRTELRMMTNLTDTRQLLN